MCELLKNAGLRTRGDTPAYRATQRPGWDGSQCQCRPKMLGNWTGKDAMGRRTLDVLDAKVLAANMQREGRGLRGVWSRRRRGYDVDCPIRVDAAATTWIVL